MGKTVKNCYFLTIFDKIEGDRIEISTCYAISGDKVSCNVLCVSYEEIEPDQVGHLFVKVAKNSQNISEFPIYASKMVEFFPKW